jgi:hypothetical protein
MKEKLIGPDPKFMRGLEKVLLQQYDLCSACSSWGKCKASCEEVVIIHDDFRNRMQRQRRVKGGE